MNDDFDAIVRTALRDVAEQAQPDPGLADRLVGNARAGRDQVTPLRRVRRGSAWTLPLLAAAAVAVVATGVVVGQQALSGNDSPATHPTGRPTVTRPAPTSTPPTTPTTPAPSTSPTASQSSSPHSSPTNGHRAQPVVTPLPAGFKDTSVWFATSQDAWALGDAKCPHSSALDCATLGRSTDGGRSWQLRAVPPGLTSTRVSDGSCMDNGDISGPCVDNVEFADADHGYLWSYHQFYATSDAGRTWQHDANGAGVIGLVVSDGVAVRLRTPALCSSGCRAIVERADLGSADWTDVTPSGVRPEISGSYLAVRDGAVYLQASDLTAVQPAVRWLRKSTDGGRNWQDVFEPCRANDGVFGMSAGVDGSLATTCYATQGNFVQIAPPGTDAFRRRQALKAGGADLDLAAVLSPDAVVASDTSHAWTWNNPSQPIWVSANGGRTWTKTATLTAEAPPRFVSAGVGYAAVDGGRELAVSTDGGTSWHNHAFG